MSEREGPAPAPRAPVVTVRRARLRDWLRVYRVVGASFNDEFVDPLELLIALLWPWMQVLLAEVDGVPAGTTIVTPKGWDNAAWISTVGVCPAFRRLGVGRALMHAAEQVTTCRRLHLEVFSDNVGACALYSSLGYREVRRYIGEWPRRERMEMEKVR